MGSIQAVCFVDAMAVDHQQQLSRFAAQNPDSVVTWTDTFAVDGKTSTQQFREAGEQKRRI